LKNFETKGSNHSVPNPSSWSHKEVNNRGGPDLLIQIPPNTCYLTVQIVRTQINLLQGLKVLTSICPYPIKLQTIRWRIWAEPKSLKLGHYRFIR